MMKKKNKKHISETFFFFARHLPAKDEEKTFSANCTDYSVYKGNKSR